PDRKLHCLVSRKLLLHLLQHPVGSRLGAEEDHGAAGAPECLECTVRIPIHDIDPSFAPPPKAKRLDAFRQFASVVLAQEEIHVVELHRISTVLLSQVAQDGFRARRALHQFAGAISSMNAAETAVEWAANARMMRGCALPEERRPQVF